MAVLTAVLIAAVAAPAGVVAGSATGVSLELPVGITVSGIVKDTHGSPVEGADVGLCSTPDNCADGGDAISGADGTFAIQPAAAATYLLRVDPPSGQNLRPAWDIGSAGGSENPADAVPIDVEADVVGREIHLADGLRIAGTVKSPESDPVAGVFVNAKGPSRGSSAASGADGTYEIVGLNAGTYTLEVDGPDGSDFPRGMVAAGVVVPTDGGPEPSPYELSGTDLTGQDITLARGRSISGHLSGATGRPTKVVAIESPVSFPFPVDAGGNFTVRGLEPGAYHLLFTVPEALGDNFPYGLYNGAGKVLADQSAPGVAIGVTTADVAGLQAVLPVLPSLSGTIRDGGGPVPGALLNACDPERGCGRAAAGADGSWKILNVRPGSYAIQAGAAHHVVVGYAAGRSNPNPLAAVPVNVGTGSIGGISVLLPRGGAISGTVTGPGGVPLQGMDVSAAPLSGGISEFGPGGVVTNASGSFTVAGLQDGSYAVSIDPPPGSPYRGGYWSTGGFTADSSSATLISVSDDVPPTVGAPTMLVRLGGQLGSSTVPVQVLWTASDPGSNVEADRLQQQSGAGAWTTVSTSVTRAANRTLTASTTTTYRFRSRATDYEGNTSADKTGPAFRAIRTQQTSGSVAWAGSWTTRTDGSPSGGSYRRTTAAGASARFALTGRAVAWVASTGPAYGRAKVYVDGAYWGTVDLHAAATSWRRVVFSKAWTSSGSHSIRIVGQATAGRPSVTVDAFVVLR